MILPEELEGVPFLQALDEPHRNRIAEIAQLKECMQGTLLFREGQDSSHIYWVLGGTISLEVKEPDGESVEVATAGPGDLLCWSPVLGRRAMTATAWATSRCRLAVLQVPRILALCERDPHFGSAFHRQIARVLADRLGSARRHLAVARTVSQRLPFASTVEGND
jgi:CRP-like cAMP-binding protein